MLLPRHIPSTTTVAIGNLLDISLFGRPNLLGEGIMAIIQFRKLARK